MNSNYDGNSYQVGNHVTETKVDGTWTKISFSRIQRPDEFHELPIAICVAAATKLIAIRKLTASSFFAVDNKTYGIFRGDGRVQCSRNFLAYVLSEFSFGVLCNMVEDYYGFNREGMIIGETA
eukprot:gene11133-12411_t